jgi:hypothetical protein
MYRDYIAHARAGGLSRVAGCPDGSNVSAYDGRGETTARLLVTDEFHSRRLDHCVGRLHRRRETPALDHS